MRVRVTQDGEVFDGRIEGPAEIATQPNGAQGRRVVVLRDDNGSKVFGWLGVDTVEINGYTEGSGDDSLSHLAPELGGNEFSFRDQMKDRRIDSIPFESHRDLSLETPQANSFDDTAPVAGGEPELPLSPVDPRYMVKLRKGPPTVYHSRPECPRAADADNKLPVSDDLIEFFGLGLCQVCQKRESQVSWQEAIEDALRSVGVANSGGVATSVISMLDSLGFKVSPSTVDRTPDDKGDDCD